MVPGDTKDCYRVCYLADYSLAFFHDFHSASIFVGTMMVLVNVFVILPAANFNMMGLVLACKLRTSISTSIL